MDHSREHWVSQEADDLGGDEDRRGAPKLSLGEISSSSTQWSGNGSLSNTPSVSTARRLLEVRGGTAERSSGRQKYVLPFILLCLVVGE